MTFPIETALAGLPRLDYTRSLSRYGLSQVTVVFEDGTDIYFARQQVAERLQQVRSQLPPGARARSWGRSRPASARSSCTPSRRTRAHASPMASRGPRPICARCRTGWSGRSCATRPASPRSTPSAASRGRSTSRRIPAQLVALRLHAARRRRRRRAQQPERRRRLHRAQRPAVPGARAGPGRGPRRHCGTSCSIGATAYRSASATWPRSAKAGTAHRRGDAERRTKSCSARCSC